VIVLKLGGAALKATLHEPRLFAAIAKCREPLVIVHGGGPEINALCEQRGLKFEFVNGQRVTTPEVMEAVEMVLSGKINPALVRGLLAQGRKAVGFSGASGRIFDCVPEDPALGLVGKVEKVDVTWIRRWTDEGAIPVISPVGLFRDFRSCNVNADLATARLAVDLRATRLLFLTDRDGILDAQGGLIRSLSTNDLQALLQSETVSGGMKVKARAILEVLTQNPTCRVEVMNGLTAEGLAAALAGASAGTLIS
jgi:acetylglutamate kinase